MLRRFRRVRRWVDTDDVLQNALLRLTRALEQVRPASTRELAVLAAEQVRRELLDLARHYYGPCGAGAHEAADRARVQEKACDPASAPGSPDELERWTALHEEVARLPAEEREVVGLRFYHGWGEAEIAELFGVTERTVRRRWRAACQRLGEALGGQLPDW
jgi:RNA polymerase sigma-70 factor (ECF subfamily)